MCSLAPSVCYWGSRHSFLALVHQLLQRLNKSGKIFSLFGQKQDSEPLVLPCLLYRNFGRIHGFHLFFLSTLCFRLFTPREFSRSRSLLINFMRYQPRKDERGKREQHFPSRGRETIPCMLGSLASFATSSFEYTKAAVIFVRIHFSKNVKQSLCSGLGPSHRTSRVPERCKGES